jgi:hypothetical protein
VFMKEHELFTSFAGLFFPSCDTIPECDNIEGKISFMVYIKLHHNFNENKTIYHIS